MIGIGIWPFAKLLPISETSEVPENAILYNGSPLVYNGNYLIYS